MLLVAGVQPELRRPDSRDGSGDKTKSVFERVNVIRSIYPSITHVDYSARLQTVDPDRNLQMYRLLTAFHALTGCPLLVNTSFNVRGEPIVCTPADAVACFLNTGLDVLLAEDFLAFKNEQSEALRAKEGRQVFGMD